MQPSVTGVPRSLCTPQMTEMLIDCSVDSWGPTHHLLAGGPDLPMGKGTFIEDKVHGRVLVYRYLLVHLFRHQKLAALHWTVLYCFGNGI